MRESSRGSQFGKGQVMLAGRCQICGAKGKTIAVPDAPAPNQFCPRCAIEYAESPASYDDER